MMAYILSRTRSAEPAQDADEYRSRSVAPNRRAPLRRAAEAIPVCIRRALIPFLLSRLTIVLILTAVPLLAQVPAERWAKDDNITIKLSGNTVAAGPGRVAIGNDAAWHYGIAHDGYERRPFDTSKQANWAFFPLHPLLWKSAAAVTGEWIWSGIVLSNLLFLAGLSPLWQLMRRLADAEHLADQATLFAAFWPTSYFAMLPHTEALFFALVTASFLALLTQRWWLAGLLGCFAGATRLNGLFLAPALFAKNTHASVRAGWPLRPYRWPCSPRCSHWALMWAGLDRIHRHAPSA